MNEDIFATFESLTFDDLLVVPGFSDILPSLVDVRGRLAGSTIGTPLIWKRPMMFSAS